MVYKYLKQLCKKLCNAVIMCEFCLDGSQVSRDWTAHSVLVEQ
jgi:hypothetical protein